MGNCGASEAPVASTQQVQQSQNVDKDICKQQEQCSNIQRLLLLGPGESGKSTLFKQYRTLYGDGYSAADRAAFRPVINHNVTSNMRRLCDQIGMYAAAVPPGVLGPRGVLPDTEASLEFFLRGVRAGENPPVDAQMADHIKTLWKDPGIQEAYKHRNEFQFLEAAAYFFDKIDEIAQPGFSPSYQDVLRARLRTTGIVETQFNCEGIPFQVMDVGGQRNERRKWIHGFEGITAVVFVVALSEYDQVLVENDTTSRMVEALNLFDAICNLRWFRNTQIILFLNKRDLFVKKLKSGEAPLDDYFPAYKGGPSYQEAVEFITKQFADRNRTPRTLYVHETCATDTDNAAATFIAVKRIVLEAGLHNAGMLS